MLTRTRLIQRSLQHHLRIHGAVALGVAAATAVLTGALIVGDSVRGDLRDLALDQLGQIDEILMTEQFFREELTSELAADTNFQAHYKTAVPLVLFPNGTLQSDSDKVRRAGQILVVGCDDRFWSLGDVDAPPIGFDDIVINEPLARELKVEVGDEILVRLPKSNDIPGDSALAHDTESQTLAGLKVIAVVPSRSLGRFSLRPNQSEPKNAYLSMERLQDALDQYGKINAMLVASDQNTPPDEAASEQLAAALHPTLTDYGLSVAPVQVQWTNNGKKEIISDYLHVSTSRLVFEPRTEEILKSALPEGTQAVSTYMAITIAVEGSEAVGIPYSTISGIEASDAFPLVDVNGESVELGDDEVVLNQWAADELGAKPGDTVRITYFAPETTHGEEEQWEDALTLRGIVPLAEPLTAYDAEEPQEFDTAPSPFNDPHFTPTVEGITDEESIADWDPPFQYDPSRIKPRDDTYWELHRTTPKAFVSMSTAARLWDSRFGLTTSFRVPRQDGLKQGDLETGIRDKLHEAGNPGFVFTPVKRQAYAASSGTTPFDGLFIALSFFIIAAALILVALLFQLGIEQRAEEIGALLAVGMSRKRASRLLTTEGAAVAGVGALIGIGLGVGYAALMITGLKHWWVDAIATPFLEMHVLPRSLAIGYLLGVAVCVATINIRLRSMRKMSIRRLLSGEASEERGPTTGPQGHYRWIGLALLVGSVVLGLVAANYLGGEMQAGGFVGSGAMLLSGILLLIWNRLRSRPTLANAGSLGALAGRNAARNPTRSTMVIGLMAVASFLIVAMSAFRLAPTLQGSGGLQLVGESSQPIKQDLNDPLAREDAGFADLENVTILSLRLKPGDDASCRNLYQSTRPRVLGVSQQMIRYYDQERDFPFQWGATAAETPEELENPWRLLDDQVTDGPIPMVLDKNTAMYSLHLLGGVGQRFDIEYPDGRTVEFKVAGLLSNSVLQGNVLIGERAFQQTYPEVEGYRYFLAGGPNPSQLQDTLEEAFSQRGLDMQLAADVLRDLLSVQNTYLSTFQSLGLLGLLLGTFGLATVQLRSVFERRKELALMRAAGFQRQQLAGMVMRENLVLLAMGLITGAVAALVAILPYGLTTGTDIPWRGLFWMLASVLVTGVITGLLAVRATLNAPLVGALRGE